MNLSIRTTRQRRAIQQVLEQAGRPLLPQEILEVGRLAVPNLNMATVYRSLNSMVGEGLVTAVHLPGQPGRFERASDHHHHFVCRACEKVFDIHTCSAEIAHLYPQGFTVDAHDLTLYGRCPECQR